MFKMVDLPFNIWLKTSQEETFHSYSLFSTEINGLPQKGHFLLKEHILENCSKTSHINFRKLNVIFYLTRK